MFAKQRQTRYNEIEVYSDTHEGLRMKIKAKNKAYAYVTALPKQKRQQPARPMWLLAFVIRVISIFDLWAVGFTYRKIGMEKLGKKEPCLVLMNHSSFIDLKIANRILFPRKYNIVCTSDGFVGKNLLMRLIGCIPTQKFVTDLALVKDMSYALSKLGSSILMYPEASYSFDGTATPLPESLGKCLKLLKVPVVMIQTYGAFALDPLYNGLQRRKVKVSADVEYLLSAEDIAAKSVEELNAILQEQFSFDNFKWQQENQVSVSEKFRTDFLNRVLYKCPHCKVEGQMVGKGIYLTCEHCGKTYELTEYGRMKATEGTTEFAHIPDWYRWQRDCVREELITDMYELEVPVDICMLVNTKCIYRVGKGVLKHSKEGFHLTGCDGQLNYVQKPSASYSLYSDYYWYELGDMICIGNTEVLYYCFPTNGGDVVAKTRLATEELYKLTKK